MIIFYPRNSDKNIQSCIEIVTWNSKSLTCIFYSEGKAFAINITVHLIHSLEHCYTKLKPMTANQKVLWEMVFIKYAFKF